MNNQAGAVRAVLTVLLFGVLMPKLPGIESPTPIDVETAVSLSLEKNLELRNSLLDLEVAKRGRDTLLNNFIPSMSLSTTLTRQDKLFSNPDTSPGFPVPDPYTLSANLRFELPISMAIFTGIEILKQQYRIGEVKYDDARLKLERDIRKAFYGLIASKASIELLEANIKTAQKMYAQADTNYQSGLIPELDLLRAEVSTKSLLPDLHSLETQYKAALMQFKLLLGVDSGVEIDIDGELSFAPPELDVNVLTDRRLFARHDIRHLMLSKELLENSRRATIEIERLPTVIISGGWSTAVNDPFDSSNWEGGAWADQGTLTATVSLPLDGFIPNSKTSVKLKDQQADIDRMQSTLELAIMAAKIEIESLIMAINNANSAIKIRELNVELARKAHEMSVEAYNLGTKEFLEVESAQNALLQAEQELLMEKYTGLSALLDLEYALGGEF